MRPPGARHERADKGDAARELVGSIEVEAPSLTSTPSELASFDEELEGFRTAFMSLAPRAQEVISLRLVEQLSHEEVAARLGVSKGSSQVLLARALAQLAQRGFAT